eukprot:TRINITY_DN2688_c0_g1_i2.p1 TRINITY_DN2688_c0_g1~~TRINITY_DN2688_c0_g1_i2.p1  ORF type:complete len:1450 (-),score=256.68 TRINITY_DN2688_c0_g1_i2:488-4606(-)
MEDSALPFTEHAIPSGPPPFTLLSQHNQFPSTYMPMASMAAFPNGFPPSLPHPTSLLHPYVFPPMKSAMIIPPRISLSDIQQKAQVKGSGGSSASKVSRRSTSMAGLAGSAGRGAEATGDRSSLAAAAAKGKVKRSSSAANPVRAVGWPSANIVVPNAVLGNPIVRGDVARGVVIGKPAMLPTPAFQQVARTACVGQSVTGHALTALAEPTRRDGEGASQEVAVQTSRSLSAGLKHGGQANSEETGDFLAHAGQLSQVTLPFASGALPPIYGLPPSSATLNPILRNEVTNFLATLKKRASHEVPAEMQWSSGKASLISSRVSGAPANHMATDGDAQPAKRQARELSVLGEVPLRERGMEAAALDALNRFHPQEPFDELTHAVTSQQQQQYGYAPSLMANECLNQSGVGDLGVMSTQSMPSGMSRPLHTSSSLPGQHSSWQPASDVPLARDPVCFDELGSVVPREVLMPSLFSATVSVAATSNQEAPVSSAAAVDPPLVNNVQDLSELPDLSVHSTDPEQLWSPHDNGACPVADFLDVHGAGLEVINKPAVPLCDWACGMAAESGDVMMTTELDFQEREEDNAAANVGEGGFWADEAWQLSDEDLQESFGTDSGEDCGTYPEFRPTCGQAPALVPIGDSAGSSPSRRHSPAHSGAMTLAAIPLAATSAPAASAAGLDMQGGSLAFAADHNALCPPAPLASALASALPFSETPAFSGQSLLPAGCSAEGALYWEDYGQDNVSLPLTTQGLEDLLGDTSMPLTSADVNQLHSSQQVQQPHLTQAEGSSQPSFFSPMPIVQADDFLNGGNLAPTRGAGLKRSLATYGGGLNERFFQLQQQQKRKKVENSAEALRQFQTQVRSEQERGFQGQQTTEPRRLVAPQYAGREERKFTPEQAQDPYSSVNALRRLLGPLPTEAAAQMAPGRSNLTFREIAKMSGPPVSGPLLATSPNFPAAAQQLPPMGSNQPACSATFLPSQHTAVPPNEGHLPSSCVPAQALSLTSYSEATLLASESKPAMTPSSLLRQQPTYAPSASSQLLPLPRPLPAPLTVSVKGKENIFAPSPLLSPPVSSRAQGGKGGKGAAGTAKLGKGQARRASLANEGARLCNTETAVAAAATKGTKRGGKDPQQPKQRPRDRQQIQERMDELRAVMGPNFTKEKMNIDGLLLGAVGRLEFLRHATQEGPVVDRAQASVDQVCAPRRTGALLAPPVQLISVTDIQEPQHYLFIEVYLPCPDRQLEVADALHKMNLPVRRGWTEWRSNTLWAHFIVEDIVKAAASLNGTPDTSVTRDRPRLFAAIKAATRFHISAPPHPSTTEFQRHLLGQVGPSPLPFSHTQGDAAVLQRRQQMRLGGGPAAAPSPFLARLGGLQSPKKGF